MAKLFTIAGTSILNGVRTYRFANGSIKVRAGVLRRNDHTEIELFELPESMEKDAAIQWLKNQGIDAELPKTGRGSGLTEEQRAELERKAAEEKAAREAAEAALLQADAEWVNSLAI